MNIEDVLQINIHDQSFHCEISPDNTHVAIEIGRPVSESKHGTDLHGSQYVETDIYIAEIANAGVLQRLGYNKTCNTTQQMFSPSWSPNGDHLAFISVSLVSTENDDSISNYEYFLSIWHRLTEDIKVLTRLAPVTRHFGHQCFFWINDLEIVVKHPIENTKIKSNFEGFDSLFSPAQYSLKQSKLARLNTCVTGAEFDTRKKAGETYDVKKVNLTRYNVVNDGTQSWSREIFLDEKIGTLIISPSKQYFLSPISSLDLALSYEYISEFQISKFGSDKSLQEVNIAPYQVKYTNIIWSETTNSVWMKVVDQRDSSAHIARLDYISGHFEVFESSEYPSDNILDHGEELVELNGRILFAYTDDNQNNSHVNWYTFSPDSSEYKNITKNMDDVSELLYCSGEVFLGCVDGKLFRYNFNRAQASKKRIRLIEDVQTESDTRVRYRVVYPKRNRWNSRVIGAVGIKKSVCVIRKESANEFTYFSTNDGFDFKPLEVSDTCVLIAVSAGEVVNICIVWRSNENGSALLSIVNGKEVVLGEFNKHLAGKTHAKVSFLNTKNSKNNVNILSEMIVPTREDACGDRGCNYATIVSIYPTMQYPVHNNIYIHNSGMPHWLNPHLFAANGYGVLQVGLPLDQAGIAENGLFTEYASTIELVLDNAADMNLIDRERLFLHGHSWGGYAATGVVAKLQYFRGCISLSGSYNPIGDYGVFDPNNFHGKYSSEPHSCWSVRTILSTATHPWDNPEYYLDSSPLFLASNIRCPLLMINGKEDLICRISDAQQMYTAMLLQDKPAKLVSYGGEGHVISSRKNLEHAWMTMLNFISDNDVG